MMDDKVIVVLKRNETDTGLDVEVPLNISANELIYGLKQGLSLRINMDDPDDCYLRMENPIGILRGDSLLRESGIRNGSRIYVH